MTRTELINRHRVLWPRKSFQIFVAISVGFFILSALANFYAGTYATNHASSAVSDIILSNIPVFDVGGLFVYGAVALIIFIAVALLIDPRRIPFTLNTLALLILVRSLFITLTHIGPFPNQTPLDLGAVTSKFIFGGDLFFSNHTAIPFILALLFWDEKALRYAFLLWSFFFGITALMGHLHYSIDVLSAYFITYTVYCIAQRLFPSSRALFSSAY
jgi:hypothetical protein